MLATDIDTYSTLLRSSIDAKQEAEDSSFANSIGLKLSQDRLLVWLNEPAHLLLNNEFKNQIEQIASTVLYPKWIVKHKAGLTLIPRYNQPPESARALGFELHYGIYKRLIVNRLADTNVFSDGSQLVIALMDDYYWQPSVIPHMAIQAVTRGGKTTFLRYLAVNAVAFARQKVKEGAIDDGVNPLVVIDPKLDSSLRDTALKLGGVYVCPDFSKSDNSFIDSVSMELKALVDLMRNRAEIKKKDPKVKFKDVFVMFDEMVSISNDSSTVKSLAKLWEKLLLMSASFQIHCIASSQSFLSSSSTIITTPGRLEYGCKVLMASRITVENAQYLFKALDQNAINNLILDQDDYGTLGVGIVTNGDGNVVPFKAPYVGDLNE